MRSLLVLSENLHLLSVVDNYWYVFLLDKLPATWCSHSFKSPTKFLFYELAFCISTPVSMAGE